MTPHHCKHCGTLITSWHMREDHIDMRALGAGCDAPPIPPVPPEVAERRKALDRTWDMQRMRERLRA